MAWLVMNDELSYPVNYYPTHIVSKEGKLLPLFIGSSQTIMRGYIGLYIRDKDYDLLRHDKAYVLIHDPDVSDDDVDIEWDKVPDASDTLATNIQHIHIWKDRSKK